MAMSMKTEGDKIAEAIRYSSSNTGTVLLIAFGFILGSWSSTPDWRRARTPDGWLVKYGWDRAVFVPDPEHKWESPEWEKPEEGR